MPSTPSMPLWLSNPPAPIDERVRGLHSDLVGKEPQGVAHAPATWSLIGEHIDHFGGVVAMGLSHLQAAAAFSPRTDGVVKVTLQQAKASGTGEYSTISDDIKMSELTARANAQHPSVNEQGRTVFPEPPAGGLAARIGGVVWTMISRQLLSRETAGADITIVSDIPTTAGLGAFAAYDVAVALALLSEAEDINEAPLRARLSEVCTQAIDTFSAIPALRSRYAAALRGKGQSVCVIDYADGSVTQAPHPLNSELSAFVLTTPNSPEHDPEVVKDIRARQRFVDAACHAFGTDSLRLLPDAPQRVIEWLSAVHEVHGPKSQPPVAEASSWLNFYSEELNRSTTVVRTLRSRRGVELFSLLSQSQSALATTYGLSAGDNLAQLAMLRGAYAARASMAGTAEAVIAYVPAAKATNFARDLGDDGLIVIPLLPGATAATF